MQHVGCAGYLYLCAGGKSGHLIKSVPKKFSFEGDKMDTMTCYSTSTTFYELGNKRLPQPERDWLIEQKYQFVFIDYNAPKEGETMYNGGSGEAILYRRHKLFYHNIEHCTCCHGPFDVGERCAFQIATYLDNIEKVEAFIQSQPLKDKCREIMMKHFPK